MPPDPLLDEEEQYDSSADSDFAPDAAKDQPSDQSDSDDAPEQPSKKRKPAQAGTTVVDDGYDNSGDETIIKKGEKRRKRARAKGIEDDDEDGEGGLIKTRRQRAAE